MKHFKRAAAFGSVVVGASLVTVQSAFAAVSSVIPADLDTSEATMQGDVVAIGAVVISIALAIMGIKAVRRIAN